MFRTVLVPLDGSEHAERALPYARQLARTAGGRVALLRSVPGPARGGWGSAGQRRAAVSEAETYLTALAARVGPDVPTVTSVAYGHAADQILAGVDLFDADTIVMTTRGRAGLPHLLFGSVTEEVLARATVPVLTLCARAGEAAAAPFDPRSARLLVPLDGSRAAEGALHVARELVEPAGELVLLMVISPPDHVELQESGRVVAYVDQQEDALRRAALDALTDVVQRFKIDAPDLHVATEVQIASTPQDGILRSELERGVDLVVMSTHGRTGVRRALVGSVAGAVVRDGFVPVLLVPPVVATAAASASGGVARRV